MKGVALVAFAICAILAGVSCAPVVAADCANGVCGPSGRGLLLRRGVFVQRVVVKEHVQAPSVVQAPEKSPVQADGDCASCSGGSRLRLRFWRR